MPTRASSVTTLLDALDDPALFGSAFAEASWRPWRASWARCSVCRYRMTWPGKPRGSDGAPGRPNGGSLSRGWLVCGRRSGKSRILAAVAVYLAACFATGAVACPRRGGRGHDPGDRSRPGRRISATCRGSDARQPDVGASVIRAMGLDAGAGRASGRDRGSRQLVQGGARADPDRGPVRRVASGDRTPPPTPAPRSCGPAACPGDAGAATAC